MIVVTKFPVAPGNYHAGRIGGYRPEAVVIHLMDGSLSGTDNWFANPAAKVSAHYGIGRNGEVHQYVDEGDTAYHAGIAHNPTWEWPHKSEGVGVNTVSIGVEFEGTMTSGPWPDAMYAASAELLAGISRRWSIPLDRQHVVGHREVRSDKQCPGPDCDLDRLIREALAF